jgi:hypothetical protein
MAIFYWGLQHINSDLHLAERRDLGVGTFDRRGLDVRLIFV